MLNKTPNYDADVLVVGSGPIGATYARKLVEKNLRVLMVEAGAQESAIPGDHKKNAIVYQKDLDSFDHVIKGSLHLTSVPTDSNLAQNRSPISWSTANQVVNWQNPKDDEVTNFPAHAVSRNVGGMSILWTCATPEQHPKLERSKIFSPAEWDRLYKEAKKRIGTKTNVLEDSIRQQLILDVLGDHFQHRHPAPLPLAARRNDKNKDLIIWSSASTILGDIAEKGTGGNPLFTLWSQHVCEKLQINEVSGEVAHAEVKNLATDELKIIRAKKYVICGGAVLTPQLLHASGFRSERTATDESECFRLPALGHYLTEHSMCFCQVVLKKTLVDRVKTDPRYGWKEKMAKHRKKFGEDSLSLPFDDPDPQITIPVHDLHPWHIQIHRDVFAHGAVPPAIDKRTIVDLRFFGLMEPRESNYVTFDKDIKDAYGMPQPTFHFKLSDEDRKISHDMMRDMQDVAAVLGGYLPGSEPRFLPPGAAIHTRGTTRAGKKKDDSCCDEFSRVWGMKNLYVGGLNVIPGATASNPTLTAMCFAIKGAEHIIATTTHKSARL